MQTAGTREAPAAETKEETPTNVPGQVLPLVETTNKKEDHKQGEKHTGGFKPIKKRGPPENGIPSKTKIMVANIPYELSEDKVCSGSN